MTRKLKPQLEVFAQALAIGKTPVEAAKIAKYPRGSSGADNARRRANNPGVKARVAELQAPALAKLAEQIDLSVEWAAKKLAAIANYDLGEASTKVADQIAALKLLAQMQGWMAPEKREVTGKDGAPFVDLAKLTDEQLATLERILTAAGPAPEDKG